IGPLTTPFTPTAAECSDGIATLLSGDDNSLDSHITGRYTDCTGSVISCTPSPSASNPLYRAFYSPGLYCPAGFTLATTISHGMTAPLPSGASLILGLMKPDETAAFCCPLYVFSSQTPPPNSASSALSN
ncbi:hypothetical protein QBC38DRAFT_376998, partial [Podospora fimiseda]